MGLVMDWRNKTAPRVVVNVAPNGYIAPSSVFFGTVDDMKAMCAAYNCKPLYALRIVRLKEAAPPEAHFYWAMWEAGILEDEHGHA